MIHLFPVNAVIPCLILFQSLCKFHLLLLASVSEMACVCVGWCLKSRASTLRRGRPERSQRDSTLDPWGFNSHDWRIFHLFCKGLPMETRVNWHYSSDFLQWCFNRPRLWVSWAGAQLLCCLMWLWEKKETLKPFFPGEGSSKRRKDWSQHSEAKLNFSWSRRRHGRGENCILAKGVACEDMCEDGKDCGVQLTPGSARVCRSSGGRRVRGCDEARQGAWAGAQQAEVVASPFSFVYGKWVNNCIFFFKHT